MQKNLTTMSIEQFQKRILEIFSQIDKMPNRQKHTKQSALIHLMEEIGEISRQVTNEYHRPEKFNKENLGTELIDAFMFIVLLAKLYNFDFSKEIQKNINMFVKKHKKI